MVDIEPFISGFANILRGVLSSLKDRARHIDSPSLLYSIGKRVLLFGGVEYDWSSVAFQSASQVHHHIEFKKSSWQLHNED